MRYLTQMGNHIRRASNSWTENNNSISIEDVLNYVATVLYFFLFCCSTGLNALFSIVLQEVIIAYQSI